MNNDMSLEKNQPRTGHLSKDSPNREKRTGRDDGFGPNQPVTGHLSEESAPEGGRKRANTGAQGNSNAEINREGPTTADLTSPQDLGRDATPLDE